MIHRHRAQENRFELKYVVDPSSAREIRDYVRSYLAPDSHSEKGTDLSYAVHSVYLDTPDFQLCKATIEGRKNRYKLRVRYYDQSPDTPVFFEIKRRINDVILKRRAAVQRQWVDPLLKGVWPEPLHLYNAADPRALSALREFCQLREGLFANGQVIVSYMREAWVSPDSDDVRLTFDRGVAGVPWNGELSDSGLVQGVRPQIGGVVLELKFTDRFPAWMATLVRIFNLQRRSVAKYVECALSLAPKVSLPWKRQIEAAL